MVEETQAEAQGEHGAGPRLLILATTNQRRGAEIQADRFAAALSARGWNVTVRSLSSAAPPLTSATTLTDRGPADLGGLSLSVVRSVRSTIRAAEPDIVLAWGSATLRYTAAATMALRGGPIRGYVAIGSPSGWVRSRTQRLRYRALVSRYGFVVAVSEHTRRELVDFIGVPAPRVHVVRSGIPAEFFEIAADPPGVDLRVLVVGSLSEEKDPIAALAAVDAARAHVSVRVRFVGDGPLLDPLRREVERLGIGGSVELSGASADIRRDLAWADVLLLSSRTEGLPGVVIEAAAAGVPVVSNDVGAVGEIVEDGASGTLVPAGDPDSAGAALVRIATDPGLRVRFGRRARAIATERYSMDAAAGMFDRVLRSRLS